MKYDLHLHSKFSQRSSQWVLQKLGCPESFSEPRMLHRLLITKGMSSITLTDHNTINGCLEIADLENTFISQEVTSYFPEDGCKVHVLVYGINEAMHADIQAARGNLYDLVAYLRQRRIMHGLAHPLYSVNGKLTPEHIEKLLVLFQALELNGARDEEQNQALRFILDSLGPQDLARMAEKHGLEPAYPDPWVKTLLGGSDDHSALNAGRIHTEVPGARTVAQFLAGLSQGKAVVHGCGSNPRILAHNLYAIAYQFFQKRCPLERYLPEQTLLRFLDRALTPEPGPARFSLLALGGRWYQGRRVRRKGPERLQEVLRREGEHMVRNDPRLRALLKRTQASQAEREELWFEFVDRLSNTIVRNLGDRLFTHLSGANVFSIFETIGAGGSLVALVSPYFMPFSLFSRDRQFTRQVRGLVARRAKFAASPVPPLKVAHFTDTFLETNGVARTLSQQARLAARNGKDLTIFTCSPRRPDQQQAVRHFEPVAIYDLPEYPEQKLALPPFLRMLAQVYQEGYTYLHSATPGPLGLAALAIARILHLPISATYHTAFPQYAALLTGDPYMEDLMWRYTFWYYDQMDRVYVPSRHTGEELVAHGLKEEKITLFPRGVDLEQFHPRRKGAILQQRYNLQGREIVLYVGRVSREKNLPLLAQAFQALAQDKPRAQLVVVGDGPYLEEMKRELAGYPATFTGYLEGAELAECYASADFFVFPSNTDTFGNVVLEAQASGLPVVVTDEGGPRENVLEGRTGLVVPGQRPADLRQAMQAMLDDPQRRRLMGRAARAFMESRSFDKAFGEHWELYRQDLAQRHRQAQQARNQAEARQSGDFRPWPAAVGSDIG